MSVGFGMLGKKIQPFFFFTSSETPLYLLKFYNQFVHDNWTTTHSWSLRRTLLFFLIVLAWHGWVLTGLQNKTTENQYATAVSGSVSVFPCWSNLNLCRYRSSIPPGRNSAEISRRLWLHVGAEGKGLLVMNQRHILLRVRIYAFWDSNHKRRTTKVGLLNGSALDINDC